MYLVISCSLPTTTTTEIYSLSLHDALPISGRLDRAYQRGTAARPGDHQQDRSAPASRRAADREHAAGLRERRLRSEEHTSELQSHSDLVCRLLLEKKKNIHI